MAPVRDHAAKRGRIDGTVVGPLGEMQDEIRALRRLEDRPRVMQLGVRKFRGRHAWREQARVARLTERTAIRLDE